MKCSYKNGAEKRKGVAKTMENIKKIPKISSFLVQPPTMLMESIDQDLPVLEPSISCTSLEEQPENSLSEQVIYQDHFEIEATNICLEDTAVTEVTSNSFEPLSNDPGEWPDYVSDKQLCDIVERGPSTNEKWVFPMNEAKRRFTQFHYFRTMETERRLSVLG